MRQQLDTNIICTNNSINSKLLSSYYNTFFIYQEEIIDKLVDDMLADEVFNLNKIDQNNENAKNLNHLDFEDDKVRYLYKIYQKILE